MAEGIFLSYRRDDTRHVAGRLAGDLAERFGHGSIFRDVESIDGGEEFPVKLDRALASCAMMLVLIGPKWLDITDAQGRRRLDDPADWVRQEIAAALRRGIRVVPVLVEDTPLPAEDALPQDLRPLVKRQARLLSDERWPGDLQVVVEMLSKVPGLALRDAAAASPPAAVAAPPAVPAAAAAPSGPSKMLLVGGGGLAAIVLLVIVASFGDDEAGRAAVAPAVAVETGAGWPDLHGTWRTDTALSFYFEQDGPEVAITIREHDQDVGSGSGRLNGNMLNMTLTFRDEQGQPQTSNCDLQGVDDFGHFEGVCLMPDGDAEEAVYIRR